MTNLIASWRTLRRDPMFAVLAVLILAVGIAANVSVFTVVNSVLLKPLPYAGAERLHRVRVGLQGIAPGLYPFSAADVDFFRTNVQVFERVGSYHVRPVDLSGGVSPTRVSGARMEAELWPILSTPMALGRSYTVEEDRHGDRVVVISHGLWQRLFGGDAAVLGRKIELNRRAYSVIGVLPKSFTFRPLAVESEKTTEVFFPASFTKEELGTIGDNFAYRVVGLLREGVSAAQAERDLDRVAGMLLTRYPAKFPVKKLLLRADRLDEAVVGDAKMLLLVLLLSVGAVFLIACANIGSLLVAKSLARQEEMAVRKALGASPMDLFRASLAEGLWIALPGAVLGLLLALVGVEAMVGLAPATLPRVDEIRVEPVVGLFAAVLSMGAALFFSVFPVLQASRMDPGAIRSSAKGGTQSRQAVKLGGALVAVEVALCLALLGATGLLARTYRNLLETSPGFVAKQLVAFDMEPQPGAYPTPQAEKQFYERLDPKLHAIPGVGELAYGASAPFASGWQRMFHFEGQTDFNPQTSQLTDQNVVSPNYFDVLGIPLRAGRTFTPADREGAPRVVVINETFARQFFPNGDAVGRRIRFGSPSGNDPAETIIGVVADTARNSVKEAPMPQTYNCFLQEPLRNRVYFARTSASLATIRSGVQSAVAEVDPSQVVANLRTMEQVMDQQAARGRFQLTLLAVFGGVALVLAVSGIFGVLANQVSRQTREIGIRMALGAAQRQTVWLILGRGLRPVMAGIAMGLALLWAAQKSLESLLFGVKGNDAMTLGMAAGVLVLAALCAAAVPSWRAARVDPATALRAE